MNHYIYFLKKINIIMLKSHKYHELINYILINIYINVLFLK